MTTAVRCKVYRLLSPGLTSASGVLHLGKVSREACTEVEAPCGGKGESGQQGEEQGSPPLPLVEDWKVQLEKLQNSERRLLQDKEGLCNQLRVQTEVTGAAVGVASVGSPADVLPQRSASQYRRTGFANHKLADAINSHLLGNTSSTAAKVSNANSEQLCSTPAEKMAEKVLKILDPISHTEAQTETPLNDDSSPNFLNNKKSIGRFHPYTRYENITFNCCERCTGDIIVL
ncbi:hypothetical protein WMY93_013489 [Mugilogobius chulae]|uniref:Uncharacterized protein n=1 Tax=Mugilogobius chulae TaxID=88201 RepID=A0AAW0P0E4_9GOBI